MLAVSVIPITELTFGHFPALLGLDGQRGNRSGFKPLQADFLAGFFAITVAAIVDSSQRRTDLANHFAFPVSGAQFQTEFRFLSCTIVRIRETCRLILHMVHGTVDFAH